MLPAYAGGEQATSSESSAQASSRDSSEQSSSSNSSEQLDDPSRAGGDAPGASSPSAEADHERAPSGGEHALNGAEATASMSGRQEDVASPSGSGGSAGAEGANGSGAAGAHAGLDKAASKTGKLRAPPACCPAVVLVRAAIMAHTPGRSILALSGYHFVNFVANRPREVAACPGLPFFLLAKPPVCLLRRPGGDVAGHKLRGADIEAQRVLHRAAPAACQLPRGCRRGHLQTGKTAPQPPSVEHDMCHMHHHAAFFLAPPGCSRHHCSHTQHSGKSSSKCGQ